LLLWLERMVFYSTLEFCQPVEKPDSGIS
jgi:hypothetical protein